ncbi:HNH endonuclease [Mesorhizobium sp. M0027]|uniref:HNH endonuclease signature motif containing protein n=1 Tax=Mesorhizobium sp. M0027 TaxID=2956848 RepID=UPI00333B22C5
MKGDWIHYSDEELSFLEWRQAFSRRELHAAFVARFGRTDVTIDNIKSLCTRKGWSTGRDGCFVKGQTPLNKGRPCPPGKGGRHPNARKTQFKKGARPHTYRGPGHERIDEDGYVWLIVAETNPHTGAPTRPVMKHKWLWEKANGRVPKGMALKSLDGNRLNTDPSNWKLIPRAMLPRLGGRFGRGYDNAPAELKPTIMAIAELEVAALERARGKREPKPVGRRPGSATNSSQDERTST